MTTDDRVAMRAAIAAARAAMLAGDRPYGAALVDAGGVLRHASGNRQDSLADCTAHAEMQLVREAALLHGAGVLRGATAFASGEPCAMCAGALFWAGVARVVYAATWDDMATILGGALLPAHAADVLAGALPPVRLDGPLLREESVALLHEAARRRALSGDPAR